MIKIELVKNDKPKKKESKTTNISTPKKRLEFSKRLLIYDYFIALILLAIFFLGLCINGIYIMIMANRLIEIGMDVSMIATPFDLAIIGTVLGIWAGQLAISSAAYYFMVKSDHRVQIPIMLINDLPQDVKNSVDMTQIIVSALNVTTN